MALISPISFSRFDRFDTYLGRLDVISATHSDALDGTDQLVIKCFDQLDKGDRVVWIDRQGVAHEQIVDQPEGPQHTDDGKQITEATCINSVAELWDDWISDKRPSGTPDVVLSSLLDGTRWSVGNCDCKTSVSMTAYHESVREALAELLEKSGGELETVIELSSQGFISSRSICIRAKRGDQDSPKRFTWSKDLISIVRSVASDNPKTRVYGYGKGVETESGGYGRRLTFESITGLEYVEDTEATKAFGHYDADGNIVPACTSFVDEDCEDPETLLEETQAYLDQVKQPSVTYKASVLDLESFGRDWEGVGVGDKVAIIDKGFGDSGLRLSGRVSMLEKDLLTGDTTVTFGTLVDSMTDMIGSISQSIQGSSKRSATYDAVASTSSGWLSQLQSALNVEFDAAGTYKVETFELGSIYSNVALDGTTGLPVTTTSSMWAVNIGGHGIRLASGLTADGQWDWQTFITGKEVVADLINAGTMMGDRIRTGLLTDEAGANFWNLDTGEFSLASTATVGGSTVKAIADASVDELDTSLTQTDVFNRLTNNGATQGIFLKDGKVYINANYLTTGIIKSSSGGSQWNLETGLFENEISNIDQIHTTGYSKTQGVLDDVVWQDYPPADYSNYSSHSDSFIASASAYVVAGLDSVTILIKTINALTSPQEIGIGWLETAESEQGVYIDQVNAAELVTSFGHSYVQATETADWFGNGSYPLYVVTGDSSTSDGSLPSYSKNANLFALEFGLKTTPPVGTSLNTQIYIKVVDSSGTETQDIFALNIPNEHLYPYAVDEHHILTSTLRQSKDDFFGFYEGYDVIYKWRRREETEILATVEGESSKEELMGGFRYTDGFLTCYADQIAAPDGTPIKLIKDDDGYTCMQAGDSVVRITSDGLTVKGKQTGANSFDYSLELGSSGIDFISEGAQILMDEDDSNMTLICGDNGLMLNSGTLTLFGAGKQYTMTMERLQKAANQAT